MSDVLSPTIHESLISRHFSKDAAGEKVQDEGLALLEDAALACRVACEKSAEAKQKIGANKMQTDVANSKQVHEVSFKHLDAASRKVDAAVAKASALVKQIENETSAPAQTKDAVEIRAALARLSSADRGAAIHSAIETGDDALVAAVLTGHPVTCGLSENEREMRRHSWRIKRRPEAVDRVNRIRKATRDLEMVAGLSRQFIFSLVDIDAIEKAAATEKAAREAIAA